MKTPGIVGGIAPESTVDSYRSLIQLWRERIQDGSAPSVVFNDIDLMKMLALITLNDLSCAIDYLSDHRHAVRQRR